MRHLIVLPLFVFLFLFSTNGYANSWANVSFSAEVIRSQTGKSKQISTGRMYVSPDGIRTETVQQKKTVWMIFKPAMKTVWTLFPEQKSYFERTNYALDRPPLPAEAESPCRLPTFSCNKIGQELVEGRLTNHWQIELRDKKGTKPHANLWVDFRLKLAIVEKYADGLTVRMKQIQEGPQPPSLFQIPQGFHKITLPTVDDAPKKP